MGRPAQRCPGCKARSEIHGLDAEQTISASTTRRGHLRSASATAAMEGASCNGRDGFPDLGVRPESNERTAMMFFPSRADPHGRIKRGE